MVAGRQREFDKEEALGQAMKAFWRNGYNGTSLTDLTTAMNINKPSLYAAFGNKEKLFIAAINQYVTDYGDPHLNKLLIEHESLEQRLKVYLNSIVIMLSDSKLPGGCFVAISTSEVNSTCLPEDAIKTIVDINETLTKKLTSFFKNESAKGNTNPNAKAEILADNLKALQFGLAILARGGTDRKRLRNVIDCALSNFIA